MSGTDGKSVEYLGARGTQRAHYRHTKCQVFIDVWWFSPEDDNPVAERSMSQSGEERWEVRAVRLLTM